MEYKLGFQSSNRPELTRGKYLGLAKEFAESGDDCVSKAYEDEPAAKRVQAGLASAIRRADLPVKVIRNGAIVYLTK